MGRAPGRRKPDRHAALISTAAIVISGVITEGRGVFEVQRRNEANISSAELSDDPFIHYPAQAEPTVTGLIVAACGAAGFTPQIAQEARHLQTVISLIAAGEWVFPWSGVAGPGTSPAQRGLRETAVTRAGGPTFRCMARWKRITGTADFPHSRRCRAGTA